jgi:hypothetical protein
MSDIRPTFKYISKYKIRIVDENTGNDLGCIETPSSTITDKESAIQICGFDYAVDLWGCGPYGYIDDIGNYHAKKDIQLLWTNLPKGDFDLPTLNMASARRAGIDNCFKCYSKPCKCNELRIYQNGEHVLDKL